jgi:hypothetical protein
MKNFIAKLLGYQRVWIQESIYVGGCGRVRWAKRNPFGLYAYAESPRAFKIGPVKLNDDGTTSGCLYVTRWKPA